MQELKFDKKIFIACIAMAILIPAFFYVKSSITGNDQPIQHLLGGFLYSFIVSVSIFAVNIKTLNFLNRKFPGGKKITKRIISEIFLTNVNAVIIILICASIFYLFFNSFGNKKLNVVIFSNIIIVIMVNTLALSVLEGHRFFKQWKISLIQTEQLKRENILSQFEALKNQIDPHFLFNSMNTVYSLIDTHPEKAKEFIAKFSNVYRRVLDVKEKLVVPLKEEIVFLNSFIFLQKIRHEGNLEISINIEASQLNNYILPLSLQMLVENAIKHNIISEKKPLKIKIFNNSQSLIIKNNLQTKDSGIESTKVGLNNLIERYKHISEKTPEFYIKNNEYIAEIPLLNED